MLVLEELARTRHGWHESDGGWRETMINVRTFLLPEIETFVGFLYGYGVHPCDLEKHSAMNACVSTSSDLFVNDPSLLAQRSSHHVVYFITMANYRGGKLNHAS